MEEELSWGRELSACETLIMKAVWDAQEDISLMELKSVLKDRFGKDYSRTTVSTFLLRLSEKGFVKTYRNGKNSYIHPIKKEEDYKNSLMNREMDFWFGGRPSALVASLYSDGQISREEADEIRKVLDGFED